MSEDVVEMTGVEMFSEGTWNGNAFSSDDIDSIVEAFAALSLSGRVPLKLGHEGPDSRDLDDPVKNPLKQLAFGWVTKVYREGKKLLADWEVPAEVHSLIKRGFLRHVSVELLKDVQAGTRVIPWVLDAVALLGSDQPAIGILKNLKKSLKMASEAVTLPSAARIQFSSSREDRINFHIGDSNTMSDSTAIKELADKIAAMQQQIVSLGETNANLKTENSGLKDIKAKFTALDEQVKKDKVNAARKAIVDRLEAAVKSEDIQPKTRASFTTVYGVEDDDQVMKITSEQVEDFIKANPNPFKKRVSEKVVSLTKADGDVPAGTRADDEAVLRVDAMFREQGKAEFTADDIVRNVKTMFKLNPSLADRYRESVLVMTGNPAARQ